MQPRPFMAPLRLLASLALVTACYREATFDRLPAEPTVVAGPPGGAMDPQWQPGYPGADADPENAMGAVTDAQIDITLDAYGEWIEQEDYGRVWRPYAT